MGLRHQQARPAQAASTWCDEIHNEAIRFGLRISAVLYDSLSQFQRITAVESVALGRALMLDGMWMVAEGDERTYHEMLVHPALTTARQIARVLIIGGGDGGTAREVLRYPEVEHVDLVEIDRQVVETCREFLRSIGGEAWNDPRLHVHFSDGNAFLDRATTSDYDVIIVDGSDPVGPAVTLFAESFFERCAAHLGSGGVFVTQAGSPRLMLAEHLQLIRRIGRQFETATPYYAPIGIYPGGAWSFVYAGADADFGWINSDRLALIEPTCEYYNDAVHRAASAQPNQVKRALSDDD